MREILFRGKRIDNGEWAYGYYVTHRDVDGNILHYISVPTEIWGTGRKYYIVDPSTIGQCTGLTDKSGNEIFEGDIVKTSHGGSTYYAKIEWDDGSFWVTNHDIQMPSYISEVSKTYLEVIGNIYDTPELLEDKP